MGGSTLDPRGTPMMLLTRRALRSSLSCTALVLMTTLPTSHSPASAAEDSRPRPEFNGHWVLDAKKSDLPAPGGMRDGMGGPGGRRGGGPGGMGGPPGGGMGGPPGGGMGGPPPSGEGRRGPGGFLHLPDDMVVDIADRELTVLVRGLPVRRMRFPSAIAGVPPTDTLPSLEAKWDGDHIVATAPTRRGTEIEERWELGKDGRTLVVKTVLPAMAERPAFELKRVYQRSESD